MGILSWSNDEQISFSNHMTCILTGCLHLWLWTIFLKEKLRIFGLVLCEWAPTCIMGGVLCYVQSRWLLLNIYQTRLFCDFGPMYVRDCLHLVKKRPCATFTSGYSVKYLGFLNFWNGSILEQSKFTINFHLNPFNPTFAELQINPIFGFNVKFLGSRQKYPTIMQQTTEIINILLRRSKTIKIWVNIVW